MKHLRCQRGQGSVLLVLIISAAIGIIASSLMLNMMNLQRASISLRIRSVTIRALEEIAQEVKQAYDLGSQTNTDCTDLAATLVGSAPVTPRFCFLPNAAAIYYYKRFTLARGGASVIPIYSTVVKNESQPDDININRMFAKGLPFLKKAFAFTATAFPYLPTPLPASPTVQLSSNACTPLGDEPCIACGINADCYQFDVCMNTSTTCAAPFVIRPIFGFMK